jgi:hypothetical protein
MVNEISSEIVDIIARFVSAQEAAERGNTGAMEEVLSEASHRIHELLRDVEIEGRGNQATPIQNTDA